MIKLQTILVEKINFEKDETKRLLEKLDSESTYKVQHCIYYPYLFFEYSVQKKNFFDPIEGKLGCTIDGVNKIGALIDTYPLLDEKKIADGQIVNCTLSLPDAEAIAKKFLLDSILRKRKVFTIPKLKMTQQKIFYRPYWIVKGNEDKPNHFLLLVDAVSGKFHPLH